MKENESQNNKDKLPIQEVLDKITQHLKGLDRDIDEIEKSWSNIDKEEKIKSLNLFDKKYPRLTTKKASDFLAKIQNDSDEDVKSKADEIFKTKVKPFQERSDALIGNELANQIDHMDSVLEKFTTVQSFAKVVESSLNSPVTTICQKIEAIPGFNVIGTWQVITGFNPNEVIGVSGYASSVMPVVETISNDVVSASSEMVVSSSPLVIAENYARSIKDHCTDSRTLSQALKIPEAWIRKDLEIVKNADTDPQFNIEGYKDLFKLETDLRNLIQFKIIDPHQKSIKDVIPNDILSKSIKKMKSDEDDPLIKPSPRWIDYTDFTHLAKILNMEGNKARINTSVNDKEFHIAISKLYEMESIRNKIAHSRQLTKDELTTLSKNRKDVLKLLNKKSKEPTLEPNYTDT
jgi:hypothetical protein